ncbi:Protein kinase-like domain superfamily [Arabidopsis suecica]|uniref:Protein kinase-like domain superfamily n=1 Tax=Arabidopsis suecica TaxID=45249 RepID=A0A8T1XQM3_ARASU|nr:Protein kinase-like domain superfamily [Arabidopsis suecica]
MGRLNKKLQDSLMSEIFILRRINHPNIIRLLDMIESPGKIHLVLEFCKGGDLSVPEATAKHFMLQLVERLTFEEFFGHPFRQSYELSRSRLGSRAMDDFLSSGSSPSRNMEESSQDDCLPFLLDDDSSGPEGSPSHLKRTSSMRSSSGFNIDARVERKETGSSPLQLDDSQDSMDQDYVLVSGPPVDLPSSSSSSSKAYNFPFKSPSPPVDQNSAPSTSHGSLDLGDAFEQPSTNSLTRISSLKKCAATIAELVHERIKSDKHLEAFSIQLAILAIWKQALHICHTQAISGLEGSPSQDINKLRGSSSRKHERITDISHDGLEEISSRIRRQFIRETEILINLVVGNTMMPDAMETIFEAALDLGKLGGVKEVMGDIENAGNQYSKAVRLLCRYSPLLESDWRVLFVEAQEKEGLASTSLIFNRFHLVFGFPITQNTNWKSEEITINWTKIQEQRYKDPSKLPDSDTSSMWKR